MAEPELQGGGFEYDGGQGVGSGSIPPVQLQGAGFEYDAAQAVGAGDIPPVVLAGIGFEYDGPAAVKRQKPGTQSQVIIG